MPPAGLPRRLVGQPVRGTVVVAPRMGIVRVGAIAVVHLGTGVVGLGRTAVAGTVLAQTVAASVAVESVVAWFVGWTMCGVVIPRVAKSVVRSGVRLGPVATIAMTTLLSHTPSSICDPPGIAVSQRARVVRLIPVAGGKLTHTTQL